MTSSRKISAALAASVVLLATGVARADDATELESAKASYDAGRYPEGAEAFRKILDPTSSRALRSPNAIERARAYYAACLIALGKVDEAKDQFEKLLRQNPRFKPDPVVFPRQVTDPFFEV